jgi:hypothetical protein
MADTPINEFLWGITLPAVHAAWNAGRNYAESGDKYVPRVARPHYKENEFGWPSTLALSSFDRLADDALIDWREMFGPAGEQLTRVAIEDVPELSSAIEEVVAATRSDPSFARHFDPFADSENVEWRESQLRHDYLKNFVATIIARADAIGVDSDRALLDIYLQLERARFWTTLKADLVVPVALTDFGSDVPIELGNGVRIERMSRELQCARAPSHLFSSEANPYLTAAATHAIVVQDISIDNRSYTVRKFGVLRGFSPVTTSEMDKVDRAIQATHVVTDAPTGYTQTLVRPRGWADGWTADLPPLWRVASFDNYPLAKDFRPPWGAQREPLDPVRVSEIAPAFSALTAAPKSVGLAARRSIRAMMRMDDEDRTLDAMIGIEALLLDNQPELKFRMALRAAAALSAEYETATIFGLAKNIYDHRSEIAHGGNPKKANFTLGGQTWRSADIAPFLLRALLRNYLLSPKPWTKEQLDDRVLTALAAYSPSPGDAW